MKAQAGLLLFGLYRHLSDVRLLSRNIDSLGIQRVRLVSTNKCTNMLCGEQFNAMSHAEQHSCPVMGATASFHRYNRRGTVRKGLRNLRAFQFASLDFACLGADDMQLKYALGDIHTDDRSRVSL